LLLLLLFFAAMVTFGQVNIKKFRLESRDLIFLSSTLLLFLLALKGIELLSQNAPQGAGGHHQFVNYFYLLPLAGAVMLVRMVKNSEIALSFAVVIAVLGGMVAQQNIYFVVYTLIGSVIGAQEVRQCRQRSTILRAGLILGVVNVLLILTISLINHQFLNQKALLINSLFGFTGGIVVAIFVAGLAPLAEWVLGYATDIKLLELLNQDHPVLKDLSMRAPGTHQHSLMVANLSEEAANAIGANPLLARVTAMYHDIGKMNKPPYYAENQWDGTNIHDQLSPSMSTLIIHNHVKEGVELALKHKLPRVVVESIRQHHGTSLVQFFYERAKELNDTGVPVNEVDYRYPGPKPQTREAAIIMLADAVESAARSLREPDPARLQGMVQKLINRFFIDGQLDECDLTLKDLHMIARSFNKTLGAIYHHRPDYPLPAAKGTPAEKRKKADQDAAKPKDDGTRKEKNKGPDDQDEDKDQNENYLKRLGM